jgi:hypothetical protein
MDEFAARLEATAAAHQKEVRHNLDITEPALFCFLSHGKCRIIIVRVGFCSHLFVVFG